MPKSLCRHCINGAHAAAAVSVIYSCLDILTYSCVCNSPQFELVDHGGSNQSSRAGGLATAVE